MIYMFFTAKNHSATLPLCYSALKPSPHLHLYTAKNRSHKMKPILLSLLSSLLCLSLPAMPTPDELSKADPLIQELMKDLNALRSGKKTREQVGDAAAAWWNSRVEVEMGRRSCSCEL